MKSLGSTATANSYRLSEFVVKTMARAAILSADEFRAWVFFPALVPTRLVGAAGAANRCAENGERVLRGVVGVPSRFDSRATSPTLRRCGVRLGVSRRYHQRDRELARPAIGSFSFAVSTH